MNVRRFTELPRRQWPTAFRDGKAERLGRLEVDDELELGRLHDRQIAESMAVLAPVG
jgi:hypothetical protein